MFAGDGSVAAYGTKSLSHPFLLKLPYFQNPFSAIMTQAIVDPTILDGNIVEVCEKLDQLSKRERDIETNDRTDIDIVEKDNLRRIESKDVI